MDSEIINLICKIIDSRKRIDEGVSSKNFELTSAARDDEREYLYRCGEHIFGIIKMEKIFRIDGLEYISNKISEYLKTNFKMDFLKYKDSTSFLRELKIQKILN